MGRGKAPPQRCLRLGPIKLQKRSNENLVFAKPLITARAGALVETPVALKHNDSVFCWCDPLVEVNDNGQEEVVHKEVTWN
jgi:hypothetical protein